MLIKLFSLLILFINTDSLLSKEQTEHPLYHVPFNNRDLITPNTIFQRYPEQKLLLRPQILAYRLLQIPYIVRDKLMYSTFTVFNKTARGKCHTSHCLWTKQFPNLIQKKSQIRNTYFIYDLRDECHIKFVRELIEDQGIREPEFSRTMERIGNLLAKTPTWMMSIDLKNPLERQRILTPDSWMLFKDFESQKRQAQKGSNLYPWNQKVNKIFWRGMDSGVTYDYVDVWSNIASYFPRMEIVRYARDYPGIVDARFNEVRKGEDYKTRMQEQGLYLMSNRVSIPDHIKFKYLISIDGMTTAWFRPQWIMSSNSLLVKQESFKVEWFYHKLIPKKHYYPVAEDLSDLLEAYKYMEEHQEQMQNITKQAHQFVRQNFGRGEVEAAFFEVLQQYSNHQNFHSVFEPLMWPGCIFEEVFEQFNEIGREKIFPPIGQIHQCKEQAKPVQADIPPSACQLNQSKISPYISLALIGISFLYFFMRLRIMYFFKKIREIQKN